MNHKSIDIAEEIFRFEQIPFERITDPKEVMRLLNGKMNDPRDHIIRPIGSQKIFLNFYDVVEWINNAGMRLC